eukprot:gene15681-11222_t
MPVVANLLKEEGFSIGDLEPFLPTYNEAPDSKAKGHGASSRHSATVALENITTGLQTIVFANPLAFVKHLLDFPSLQRCIESYLCHRYKPFERQQDDSINHKQSHHMLLLLKLDKLVVAIYKRLVEVYNKECTHFHRFAASSKLSVFKSNDKGHQDDEYMLQAELRSLLHEKLRILRLPYLLELVALMGESNTALAASLLSALTQIRPAITSEIVPAIRESHQAAQDLFAGIASNSGDASSLSIEGSIFFAADIAHSLAVFSLALPVELFYTAGLVTHGSAELTVDGGVHLYRTAQLISERIVPTLTETLKAFTAGLPDGGISTNTKSNKKNNNGGDYLSDMQELQRTLHTAQLAAMRLFHRLLEVSVTPLPSDAPASSFSSSSSSAAAAATSEALPSQGQSWFELFSAADSGSATSASMLLDYLTHLPNGLSFVEPLLVPTFGDEAPPTTATATATASAAAMENDPVDGRPPVSAALQSKIDMLKDMFPDCGVAFLEACLRFYNEQEHEVLDALLNDNLHPRLAALDRSMETFPKKATATSMATSGGHKKPTANETVDIFAHRQDPTFVAQQIAYVRQREALQAADAALLRREYEDDYDDQFDDLISKKDTAAENEYAESIYEAPSKNNGAGGAGNGRKREEWHRQMAETRRYNTLLREEENEIAFWKNLAVQNHRAPSASAAATAGEGAAEAATTMKTKAAAPTAAAGAAGSGKEPASHKAGGGKRPAQTAGEGGGKHGTASPVSTAGSQPHKNNSSGKVERRGTATAEEDSSATIDPQQQQQGGKGFRTKTFDRHHQKDKALRKMGAFRPT